MFIRPPSIVGNTTPDSNGSVHHDGVPQGYGSSAVLIADGAIAGAAMTAAAMVAYAFDQIDQVVANVNCSPPKFSRPSRQFTCRSPFVNRSGSGSFTFAVQKGCCMGPQSCVAAGAVLILGGAALPFATSVPIWVGLIVGLIGLVLAVRAVIADSSQSTSAWVPGAHGSGHRPVDQADDGQPVLAAEHAGRN